ncbi:adenylate/guanylate cyclase domain-containing protein [Fulvivirga sp. 29W222]|uniref:Adenylate/guanylate cyclase domain-containing protein n=1 Tax=Fulvivirga marina TaxID=2494733 RepID=A0A937FXB4_9BACT|nr:adenylate/guanylate cyclase domain-containing protein [Fulvivirga marina]MBL6446243.1 adenylate/guanylate cyclase domain-containing protein [Fulvivirga marina]
MSDSLFYTFVLMNGEGQEEPGSTITIGGKKRYIINSTLWVMLYWLIIGVFVFGYENIIVYQYRGVSYILYSLLIYIVPPVLFGIPFLILEQLFFLKWINRLNFYMALFTRAVLYLAGIYFSYSLVQHYGVRYLPATLFQEPFILKFVFVWGLGSILALMFHNLSSRHDPKIFKSWLKGAYHKPNQEERVFLFCDINKSTPAAEQLGSRKYFDFLNHFYSLIAPIIQKYKGEIYQYVGDEVVISWPLNQALKSNNALELFFSMKEEIAKHNSFFYRNFRFIPTIKGSLHVGQVTRGEINTLKREFIYTGDVLNTASRMYSICKEKDVPLVISRRLLKQFSNLHWFHFRDEGIFQAEGKQKKVYLYSVERKSYRPIVTNYMKKENSLQHSHYEK